MNAQKRRRLSPYVSRLTTNHFFIWEICALMGTVPIKEVLLVASRW